MRRSSLIGWVAASLSVAAAAHGAERPGDFAYGAPIQADGSTALYRVRLSRDVYRGIADPDLADLRVFNGAGEIVPYAFYPRQDARSTPAPAVALKAFAIPVAAATGPHASGEQIHVETNGQGAVVRVELSRGGAHPGAWPSGPASYLLDASALSEPLRAVTLDIRAAGDYSGKARLEASDDLVRWREVAGDAPILGLTRAGERLERRRIEFAAQKSKYYRLVLSGMPPETELAAVNGQPADVRAEPEHQWEALTGSAQTDRPGDYTFDSKGHFPADRLRVELPQSNTVAPLQIFVRNRPEDAWRLVASETAYRLNLKDGEITSPPLAISVTSDRYWLLRVDQRSGGLGSGPLGLALGWAPHEIAFAARGAPPFLLAFGQSGGRSLAIGMEALVPGYRANLAEGRSVNSRTPDAVMPEQAALLEASPPGVVPIEPGWGEKISARRVALWLALCGGVALLAWMAWRLLKQVNSAGSSP